MSYSSNAVDVDSRCSAAPQLWFTAEIQHMMHGFGDCSRPLPESAAVVESIVYRQMLQLLRLLENVAMQRNSRFIGIEDYIFLLRRDKNKLRRLLRFLEFKDMKTAAIKGINLDDDETAELVPGAEQKSPVKKRRKICVEFLNVIDPTGELLPLLDDNTEDEVKLERKIRAEAMTRDMDAKQYLEYCEARQASFTPRYKMQKLKDWLLTGLNMETKLNQFGLELLSYMAYETVAQIVDLALTVRRDKRAVCGDPFTQEMAPVCQNYVDLADNSLGNVSGASGSSAATAIGSLDAAGSRKISKPMKQLSYDIITSQAIQPSDIYEALRRYTQPIGPFAVFSKTPLCYTCDYLLCC